MVFTGLLVFKKGTARLYVPGHMLNGVLEEYQLGLLGEGHVVIIEVVLENSLDLIHVCKILIHTSFLLYTHLMSQCE